MAQYPSKLKIIKCPQYSSNPWRVVTQDDREVWIPKTLDHVHLGKTSYTGPICDSTKDGLVNQVLDMLLQLRIENDSLLRERQKQLEACDD